MITDLDTPPTHHLHTKEVDSEVYTASDIKGGDFGVCLHNLAVECEQCLECGALWTLEGAYILLEPGNGFCEDYQCR